MPDDAYALLWDEYKYRHDHIWKKLLQITLAVVALGAVPYAKPEIARALQSWVLIAPLLGSALAVISLLLMHFELGLFARIANAHRQRQTTLGLVHHQPSHYFRHLVMAYVGFLCLSSLANMVVVQLLWLRAMG